MPFNFITGTSAADVLRGKARDDLIRGEAGDDRLFGNDGDDFLIGGLGADSLDGFLGDDTLSGGAGDDYLFGIFGEDSILGGSGDDEVRAGARSVSYFYGFVDAGSGDDTVTSHATAGSVFIGGDGTDHLILVNDSYSESFTVDLTGVTASDIMASGFESTIVRLSHGDDTIIGTDFTDDIDAGFGNNIVWAGNGDDIVTVYFSTLHTIDGGNGDDTLRLVSPKGYFPGPLVFTAADADVSDSRGSVFSNFEHYDIAGYFFEDINSLGSGDDTGNGGRGSDWIDGGAGRDRLLGGDGLDSLTGGDGDDLLVGGRCADTLTGGAGADRFRFNHRPTDAADTVIDFISGLDRLVISNDYTGIVEVSQLPQGVLDAAHFAVANASGSAGQFVYVTDAAGGHLFWDAKGTGAGVEIALLPGAPALAAGDIYLF